ncbi:cell division protein FtsQ/DivIB [Clostridium sp. AM58-1XD]|uniref:cell division protein FtsQ/DivIB n=1 Tax=Clostridium sp. AM58-1XD TaxID=2292307 RepID=UPI000E4A2823|nr:cell division protein FtsQ/DivIB [Clostridium sp. AM58-1XD]RGY99687.1 cell division protein FtsQ [Clostridium sp. AM58-1XD]
MNPQKKKGRVVAGAAFAVLLLLVIAVLSMNIREITITGNTKYTNEELVQRLFPEKKDRNMAYSYLKYRFGDHEKIPFIEDYKIVFQGFHKIEVIVYEKKIVGYLTYMSSNMYFDKDGIIVESTNKKLDGIPLVTGLKFGHIVLYQPLPVENEEIFDDILNLTQALSGYEIKVDKIQYDGKRNANLIMGDIEVVLGDDSDINGKISALNDMLPALQGMAGVLYLDTFDETNTSMMYTFKKK